MFIKRDPYLAFLEVSVALSSRTAVPMTFYDEQADYVKSPGTKIMSSATRHRDVIDSHNAPEHRTHFRTVNVMAAMMLVGSSIFDVFESF